MKIKVHSILAMSMGLLAIGLFMPSSTMASPAPVEKTGQTTSYATGDDGDLEKGVVWPSPRFTDNGDGTVTDDLTGLIWLKNANRFGQRTWANALSDCNGLADDGVNLTDGSSAGDWRLPNIRELQGLVHYGYYNPAIPNTAGTGRWTAGDPFINVQSNVYWTSSTHVQWTDHAWYVHMNHGTPTNSSKLSGYYVWPVRGESIPDPPVVPALSGWGIMAFFLLLTGSALLVVRRRTREGSGATPAVEGEMAQPPS